MMTVIIIVPADISSTKVAVLGANSPEWFSCAVGAVMAGGLVRVNIVYVDCNHQTSYSLHV